MNKFIFEGKKIGSYEVEGWDFTDHDQCDAWISSACFEIRPSIYSPAKYKDGVCLPGTLIDEGEYIELTDEELERLNENYNLMGEMIYAEYPNAYAAMVDRIMDDYKESRMT